MIMIIIPSDFSSHPYLGSSLLLCLSPSPSIIKVPPPFFQFAHRISYILLFLSLLSRPHPIPTPATALSCLSGF